MHIIQFDVMIRSSAQAPDEESFSHLDPDTSLHGGRLVDPSDVDADGDLSHLQRQRIAELLGTWYVKSLGSDYHVCIRSNNQDLSCIKIQGRARRVHGD